VLSAGAAAAIAVAFVFAITSNLFGLPIEIVVTRATIVQVAVTGARMTAAIVCQTRFA
jgi:hypothetical protein